MTTMGKVCKPRFSYARKVADKIFKDFTDHKYPVNTLKIIKENKNIKIVSYEYYSKKTKKSIDEIEDFSKDSYTYCQEKDNTLRFLIIYNSKIYSIARIRFSVAHELGHIFLNHFSSNCSNLSEKEYSVYEAEANTFANELLIPPSLLNESASADEIYKHFDVSKQAAQVSLEIKAKHPFIKMSETLYSALKESKPIFRRPSVINNIVPREKSTIKSLNELIISYKDPTIYFCENCFNTEKCVFTRLNYCPICGERKLKIIERNQYYSFHELLEEKIMIYPGFSVNQYGRLVGPCPICGNQEIKGSFCNICGTFLVNKCSGWHKSGSPNILNFDKSCEIVLDGNDRYCPQCGAESTFLYNGILQEWNSFNQQINNNF